MSEGRPVTERRRPAFYDARQVVALPFYLVGGVLFLVAGVILVLADLIGASKHSRHLIGDERAV